jgi:hypothetical protein
MAFNEHPLRRWAVDEMRLRRFAPVVQQCALHLILPDYRAERKAAHDP